MTLSARNNFFKVGIILAALSLCITVIGGYFVFHALPDAAANSALRAGGIIQALITGFTEPSAYVPFWGIISAVLFSLVSIILIYYFFEKTKSPEILFIGLFAISFAFEFARLAIPFRRAFPFPFVYLIASSRILLFGRYFGLFSLFAASVYAAGFDAQKQQGGFISVVLASLLIASNVPINSLVWDSTFMLWYGYRLMLNMVELGIISVTIISFFVCVYTRGARNYAFIGLGTFMAYIGRNILFSADNWFTPIPGLVILTVGTWLICSRLHKEYLWL